MEQFTLRMTVQLGGHRGNAATGSRSPVGETRTRQPQCRRRTARPREMVLRDDVPTFGQLQPALGVAAAQVEADVVYDLLAANPGMPDGQPLFSAAHGNLM